MFTGIDVRGVVHDDVYCFCYGVILFLSLIPLNKVVLCSLCIFPKLYKRLKMGSSVFSVILAHSIILFSSLPAAAVCINVCTEKLADDDFLCSLFSVCWIMYSCLAN